MIEPQTTKQSTGAYDPSRTLARCIQGAGVKCLLRLKALLGIQGFQGNPVSCHGT